MNADLFYFLKAMPLSLQLEKYEIILIYFLLKFNINNDFPSVTFLFQRDKSNLIFVFKKSKI